jgi:radical SAM superfamily enzyme YgiQ (UPF0313 family)
MAKYVLIVNYAIGSLGPVPSGLWPDNGLALLAGHLRASGYTPLIRDYNSLWSIEAIANLGKKKFLEEVTNQLDDDIKRYDIKNVDFKLWSTGSNDVHTLAANIRRAHPSTVIAVGGPHASTYRNHIMGDLSNGLRGSDIYDAVCYGDGDAAVVGIADHAYRGKVLRDVPNLVFSAVAKDRTGRIQANLDELPIPVYDSDVYLGIDDRPLIFTVEDSRGCGRGSEDAKRSPCTFCVYQQIAGRLRERTIDSLLEELESTTNMYGGRTFRLSGGWPRASRINEIARRLPDGYKFSAFAGVPEGSADYDFTALGGKMIGAFIGLEHTRPWALRELYHKIENMGAEKYLQDAHALVKGFAGADVSTIVSMIIPSPFETEESLAEALEFIRRANPDSCVAMPTGVIPGTPLASMVERRGEAMGIKLDDDYVERSMNFEIDLLKPPGEQAKSFFMPYDMALDSNLLRSFWQRWLRPQTVNYVYTRDVFPVTGRFIMELMGNPIWPRMTPYSDEAVLMADRYYGSLSKDQAERRKQCRDLNKRLRVDVQKSDIADLRKVIETINKNQDSKF